METNLHIKFIDKVDKEITTQELEKFRTIKYKIDNNKFIECNSEDYICEMRLCDKWLDFKVRENSAAYFYSPKSESNEWYPIFNNSFMLSSILFRIYEVDDNMAKIVCQISKTDSEDIIEDIIETYRWNTKKSLKIRRYMDEKPTLDGETYGRPPDVWSIHTRVYGEEHTNFSRNHALLCKSNPGSYQIKKLYNKHGQENKGKVYTQIPYIPVRFTVGDEFRFFGTPYAILSNE